MIYDAIIIGGGAGGLMCASQIKGSIIVLEHNSSLGKKLLTTGGGNCNFTNLNISKSNYVSNNIERIDDILKHWTTDDAMNFLKKNKIKFKEKDNGKIFCDGAINVRDALLNNCKKNNIEFVLNFEPEKIVKNEECFEVISKNKIFKSHNIIISTGGKSYPILGASDFGLKTAKDFGLKLVETIPGLVGLKYPKDLQFLSSLAGVSLPVKIKIKDKEFQDSLLFAHYGITGPATLNTSLYANHNDDICINFLPTNSLKTVPQRVLKIFMQYFNISEKKQLQPLLKNFKYKYNNTFGYERAEVMRGGVNISYLNSELECNKQNGLYFIGEVLDITGHLGGYNLHMVFASAMLVSKSINKKLKYSQ